VSTEAIRKKPGRTEYQRGTVTTAADGTLQVRTTGNQGSGVLSSMVQANGLIVLHHGQGNVAARRRGRRDDVRGCDLAP
jgi:molybdopterin molybdotransferase